PHLGPACRRRLRWVRLERQVTVLGALAVLADGHDVGPIRVAPLHDEGDELLDLLVVQRAALLVAPGGHRDLSRALVAAALDRPGDEALGLRELRGLALKVVALEDQRV